jgi:2-aminoethylphosphonate dioxygenase
VGFDRRGRRPSRPVAPVTGAGPVRCGVLDPATVALLAGWVSEIEDWPAGSHIWAHYAERAQAGDVICRTENVSACHRGVAALVDGALARVAADRLGRPVEAFKDKLNYKHAGGAGFGAHQDVRAYPGAQTIVSVLVAVDACTVQSGCLWMASGVDRLLPTDHRGVVTPAACAALVWGAVELAPGDAVCIDGLVPHRSDANRTDGPRRVLVASYAPAAEGYGRERYYAARRTRIADASAHDGLDRISTLADFDGTMVHPPAPAELECTHG